MSDLCGQLLHRVTTRVLVGRELCRNEDYLNISMDFSNSLFICGTFFNFMATGPLRDLFAWLAITLGGHKARLDRATRDFVVPSIEKRLRERSAGIDIAAKYRDCLQYIVDAPPSRPGDDHTVQQSYQLLHLTFASTSAPGLLVCHALTQLLMYPEYLQPLREESQTAITEHNGWTDKAMSSMILMDSFLRETMRMYPAGSRAFPRPCLIDLETLFRSLHFDKLFH